MLKTKAELIIALQNMTAEKDVLVDQLDIANTTIRVLDEDAENMKEDIAWLTKRDSRLDVIVDMLDNLHIAKSRYSMGILSELENIENLTDELLAIRELGYE